MEGSKKSQAKLTRTHSSLLRSSPTIRSSIHSLSSVNEIVSADDEEEFFQDIEEQKPHSKPGSTTPGVRPGSSILAPVIVFSLLTMYTLFAFFNRDDIPTSENLLLGLVFIAVLLFFAQRNKGLLSQSFNLVKHLCDEHAKKLGSSSKNQSKPVQWLIGESGLSGGQKEDRKEAKTVREGVEFYSNGDFYEGEFHKGRCNGSGILNYFVNNGRYEGDWIDGRYDGYGIESWARGSRYRGQYRQGLRHGYGVYSFYNGDTYAGQWFNGQSHGTGVQTCSDGSFYFGDFKTGVKHGFGVYHFRNGDRYAGEYFGDKIHGYGVYRFANGHCYEGSWHEGREQGYGMYTFRSGEVRCGQWDSGKLKIPANPQADGVLHAVQAARKTAENAVRLRRVDEQVNKAVAAANKAATASRVAAVKAVQNRMDGKFCSTNV